MGISTHYHVRPNPLTDHQIKIALSWICPRGKFSHDSSRGFVSPYARNCASKCLLGFVFSGSSNGPTAHVPEPIFTHNTSNKPFRARMSFSAEMLSRQGVRDQDQDQDLKKVVLIGLETKTRSRDMYAMLLYKSSKS